MNLILKKKRKNTFLLFFFTLIVILSFISCGDTESVTKFHQPDEKNNEQNNNETPIHINPDEDSNNDHHMKDDFINDKPIDKIPDNNQPVDNNPIDDDPIDEPPEPGVSFNYQFVAPQDESITLSGEQTLSWAENNVLHITVAESFTNYNWFINGKENKDNEDNNEIKLNARDFSVGIHNITLKVTKNGVVYTKTIQFTVE